MLEIDVGRGEKVILTVENCTGTTDYADLFKSIFTDLFYLWLPFFGDDRACFLAEGGSVGCGVGSGSV